MNKNKYEVFLKVVEFGSLSQAANYCNYSQSAVSQIVSSLEKDLQLNLLTRNHAGVWLTSDGQRMLPVIENLSRAYELLTQKASQIHGIESGLIRIGTFSSVSKHLLVPLLEAFRKKYHAIDFELYHGDNKKIEEWIAQGTVDFGFVDLPTPREFETIPILSDPFVAVLAEDHPAAREKVIPFERFAQEPMVLFDEGTSKEASGLLRQSHVRPNVQFTSTDDPTILSIIGRKMAIGYMGRLIVHKTEYPVVTRPTNPQHHRDIVIAVKNRKAVSSTASCFLDFVEEQGGSFVKELESEIEI